MNILFASFGFALGVLSLMLVLLYTGFRKRNPRYKRYSSLLIIALIITSCDPILKVSCPHDTWEQKFALIDTFHQSLRPFVGDSIFDSKNLVLITSPSGHTVGMFEDTDKYLVPFTRDDIDSMGWKMIEIQFVEPVETPLVIDAGGLSDHWFEGGSVAVYDTGMYQTERYGDFKYHIPVGFDTFFVELHFQEVWWSEPAKRIFNVAIEDSMVITNLDLFYETVPYVFTKQVEVKDGYLDIEFITVEDNAKLSGIIIR